MKPSSKTGGKSIKRPILLKRIKKVSTVKLFPIGGIGASAGGLEAFTALLSALPLKTGIAYVLVQHLDPNHKSMLVDLLARTNELPVTEVKNRTLITSDHIYVIPPGMCMTLRGGMLMLSPRLKEKGPINMPIDDFFNSLVREEGASNRCCTFRDC